MRPTPFTIVIDTAEQLPFAFTTMRTDSDHEYELWDVKIERACLGRHPNSLGDYSIVGGEGKVAVERKSVADLQNTILGFNDGHRERFEQELSNLNKLNSSLVVVEGSLIDVLSTVPQYGVKTREQNAKTLIRSILAYQSDVDHGGFPNVQWQFAGDRPMAEYITFHWLRRWHEKHVARRKAEIREAERLRRAAVSERMNQLQQTLKQI